MKKSTKVILAVIFWPVTLPYYIIRLMRKSGQSERAAPPSTIARTENFQSAQIPQTPPTFQINSGFDIPEDIVLTCLDYGTLSDSYSPTERQIEYMKKLRLFIPDGITKSDASCMISRVTGEDSMNGPESWLVSMADKFQVTYSAYIGFEGLLTAIVNQIGKYKLSALYAYSVHQELKGAEFRNFFDSPSVQLYYEFATHISNDEKLLQSLIQRTASDLLHPNKNTNIYKAAKSFLIKE